MNARLVFTAVSAALVLGLAAPSVANDAKKAERDAMYAERLELAQAHAGEPVDRVRILTEPYKFEVLGDHAILVWQNQRKAWLVELNADAGCQHMVNSITVRIDTMNESDTMNTSNGYIVGDNNMRCKINGLREVDVVAMRADKKNRNLASNG